MTTTGGAERGTHGRATTGASTCAEAHRPTAVVPPPTRRHHVEQQPWLAQVPAERLVAATLRGMEPEGWTSVHDVHWPGRPLANIDHLVVGPGGVVVVHTESWAGDLVVTDGEVRVGEQVRTHQVARASEAAAAVTALLAPRHRTAVRAALCLGDRSDAAVSAAGATVVGRTALPGHLRGLPPRLTPAEVTGLVQLLGVRLGGTQSPQMLTTAALQPATRAARRRAVRARADVATPTVMHPEAGRRPASRARGLLLRALVVVTTAGAGALAFTAPIPGF
ncbi:NERD domain-containing protein [Cellulomonas sp. NPDC057328]|uniref:NERD domain-containing protein n=1 Tax=Cellulomonas sp. NPDC057328 TaxID=3346101 RepID=UPI0036299B47